MELMVALVASFIVVLALGKLVLVNQQAWRDCRDRALLQQNLSQVLDWFALDVRGATRIDLQGTTGFRLLDAAGRQLHAYTLQTTQGDTLLQRDGRVIAPRTCHRFSVQANRDTTALTITVGLRGENGKRIVGSTIIAVRNRDLENSS